MDLSRLGARDWVHWGARGDPRRAERAAAGSGLPHRYRGLASGPVGTFTRNDISFAWHDGAPNRSEDDTTTGVYVRGPGRGFRLTVALPSTPSTLELYVGSWRSPARLTARASSGEVRTDAFPGRLDGTQNVVYRLRLSPRPGGGSVRITWTCTGDHPSANVTLQRMVLLPG